MIIDFTVENYGSIHEPITLSFLPEGVTVEQLSDTVRPLKVVGVFGEPGTGKTTLLRALDHLLTLMRNRHFDVADIFACFQAADQRQNSQRILTRFAIRITIGPWIYSYHLAVDQERIHHEKWSIGLLKQVDPATIQTYRSNGEEWIVEVTSQTEPVTLFDQSWDNESQTYSGTYNTYFVPDEETGPAVSYLAQVLKFSGPSALLDFNEWLSLCPDMSPYTDGVYGHRQYGSPISARFISDFRLSAPALFEYLCLSAVDDPMQAAHRVFLPELGVDETYEMLLIYRRPAEQAPYPRDTNWEKAFQKFMLTHDLLASWFIGPPVICDDLDTQFSDRLAISIVMLYHAPTVNRRNGQLIFSCSSGRFASLLSPYERYNLVKSDDLSTAIIPLPNLLPDRDKEDHWSDVQPNDVNIRSIAQVIADRTLSFFHYSHEPAVVSNLPAPSAAEIWAWLGEPMDE